MGHQEILEVLEVLAELHQEILEVLEVLVELHQEILDVHSQQRIHSFVSRC